jgi:20S proteasome subunit alpha 2
MILAGVDDTGSRILTTDPSGAYRGFKATAVGRKSEEANKLLEENYTKDLSLEEAVKLAIDAVKTASDTEITSKNVKIAVIRSDNKTFERIPEEKVAIYLK